MSYAAIIAPITVSKHPNADKLQLGYAAGTSLVVGLETQTGDLGILFPCDGQLSEEFCATHDLIARKDENGNRAGGFFSEKRRVRAQKFRGVKSEGFWMPLDAVAYTGVDLSTLKAGDEVTTLNGHLLCEKYETKATKNARLFPQYKERRGSTKFFPKHFDTTQFRFVKDSIFNNGGLVILTSKLHGTSQRTGNVLDKVELPWWKRAVNYVAKTDIFPTRAYKILHGTRNVILDDAKPGWYGTNDFRRAVAAPWEGNLHKGEMVFYEIVGDVTAGTPIMPSIAIGDKELKKLYGPTMKWRYGCADGEAKVFVYRITRTNEDGVVTELPWTQVKQRCVELGIEYVPELQSMLIVEEHPEYGVNNVEWIKERVAVHTEGAEVLDPTHMREGCVVRVENEFGTTFAKSKSFSFLHLEDEQKSDENYVDTEEAA